MKKKARSWDIETWMRGGICPPTNNTAPMIRSDALPAPCRARGGKRCQQVFCHGLLSGALALGLLLFAGCSKSEPRKAGPPPDKQQEYTLSKGIEFWSSGKQAEAVEQFTALDWSKEPLFSLGDPLGFSDRQLAALPEGDRAQLVKKVASLKALGVHVSQLAQKAEAARNGEQAEKYAGSVSRCGEALDQPQYCTMLRQVGKAFKKLAK